MNFRSGYAAPVDYQGSNVASGDPGYDLIRLDSTSSTPYTVLGSPVEGGLEFTLNASGVAIHFPYDLNTPGTFLRVYPQQSVIAAGQNAHRAGLMVDRGATLPINFSGGKIKVRFVNISGQASVTADRAYVVVVRDPALIAGMALKPARTVVAEGKPTFGFYYDGINLVNGFDLTAARPAGTALWTAPPGVYTGGGYFSLDGVRRVSFAVLDAAAAGVSAAGTVLRPWWYVGNQQPGTSIASGVVGAAAGWVPDPNTYTIAERERMWGFEVNVVPGNSPDWIERAYDSNEGMVPPLSLIQPYPSNTPSLWTFEVTNVPVNSIPMLYVTAELLP